MTYDASDRLLRVDGARAEPLTHAYGYEGLRIKTVAASVPEYFFGDGTTLHNGEREHDVEIAGRLVARVAMPAQAASRATAIVTAIGALARPGLWGLGLVVLVLPMLGRPWLRRRARAAALANLTLATSCGGSGAENTSHGALIASATATFVHTGFAAGPSMFTGADGALVEERRFEPFGVPIDALFHAATGDVVAAPDFGARDLNELNKRTDISTGWSDHGARWMAPETGRWLSTDPPVAAPDDKFMSNPWTLHPYQFVNQNPVIYWDPDGRQADLTLSGGAEALFARGLAQAWQAATEFGPYGVVAGGLIIVGYVYTQYSLITSNPLPAGHGEYGATVYEMYTWAERQQALDAEARLKAAQNFSAMASNVKNEAERLRAQNAGSQTTAAAGGQAPNGQKPDDEDQKGRVRKLQPAESPFWKSLRTVGRGRKTSGEGRDKRYYEWDYTHGDIEAYDRNGKHLGSVEPTTGNFYKDPVPGRKIDL